MKLAAGQSILLKHTRERATVVAALDHGQYMVETALDRERFSVHGDDIDQASPAPATSVKAAVQEQAGDIRLYPNTDGAAVQLAFLPVGEIDYNVALLNHSDQSLVYGARLLSGRGQQWNRHGILGPTRGLHLGHLYRDLLNEGVHIEVTVSRKTDLGTDSKQERDVNIKPKLFYKNTRSVDWYPEPLAVFDVFDKAVISREPKAAPAPAKPAPPAPKRKPGTTAHRYGVLAAAEFPSELDLHIERLVADPAGMTPEEIVTEQLAHVRQYLDKAIRLGVDRVYLIHGKGTGALRNRVHQLLATMGDLEGFKNDYHPKYGFGATEVVLR